MTNTFSLRTTYLLGFLCCVGLMAAAYYFEYILFLDPCPLCMVQRLATVLTGIGFLLAFFLQNRGRGWLASALTFTLAACLFGLWASTHHIGLQNLPPEEVPACGPSFEYLMSTLPLQDLLSIMLQGDGNCADSSWSFLGFSMPEWLRLWFLGFTSITAFALYKTLKQK